MFQDLVVVELASVLAGPAVGMFFAEQGATVYKIENRKTGGDVTRSWRLGTEDKSKQTSAYFSSVNYNKIYVDADLKNESNRENVLDLIAKSDIVIANFKQESAKKLGMDYESIQKINSTIIYGQINGFSNSNRVAFDVVLQAETGFMSINGQPDSDPTKMPIALIDVLAAHHLKEGLLTALWKREKTGKGSFVSCSLEEAALASLANQATNYLMNDYIPQCIGSLHPNIAPYGEIVETKDGRKLVLAAGSQIQFEKLCKAIEGEEIINNELFQSNAFRVQNREVLLKILQEKFNNLIFEEIYQRLLSLNVPVGQIKNLKEVFETKTAQDLILEEEIEGEPTRRVKTVVFEIKNSV